MTWSITRAIRTLALPGLAAWASVAAAANESIGTTPGALANGAGVHGNPLKLERLDDGQLRLRWGDSCRSSTDFAVFEGQLGDFDSHAPVTCTTQAAAQHTFAPGDGARYYLVAPLLASAEGSHGTDGGGTQRPTGPAVCQPQVLGDPVCPPAGNWSDPATWPDGVPATDSVVTIPAGEIVVLDSDVDVLSLQIDGELHCTDESATIHAESVMVAGRLKCGSAASPYTEELEIVLEGVQGPGSTSGMGNKVLGITAGGVLELHGEPRTSWTQIAATAEPGTTQLTLAEQVDWKVQDEIVIAPTHSAVHESEPLTITSVGLQGTTIGISPPLAYRHYGQQSTYGNGDAEWTLDERAEVGLLSRNITIRGDDASATSQFGGHLMAMEGSSVTVSGVELRHMGQKGLLARYPFHWHLAGSVVGQYLRNSSIHRSFNRCVTVHGTHDAVVADNVCYDFIGHGYFLEDGIEQDNLFDGNLGLWARKPVIGEHLLETDYRSATASNGPAVFWIGNPNNSFVDNVAAGSQGTGYWYGMPDQVTGASAGAYPGYNPQTAPFGVFDGNRVHSSHQGISTCEDPGGPAGINPQAPALFRDVTVNHTFQGIWPCVPQQTAMQVTFESTVVANSQNAMQAPNPVAFVDSAFVGYSDNTPQLALPGFESNWRAVQVYDQGFLFDGVHFANYDVPSMTVFYPGGGAHKHSNNRGQNLSFANAPNLLVDLNEVAQVGAGPASWGDVVHDLDGSAVGVGLAVVHDHPLMYDTSCTQPTTATLSGYACPYRYSHFRTENFTPIAPITIIRSDGYENTSAHIEKRFVNEFISDAKYLYSYRYEGGMEHQVVQVHLRNALDGETAVYELLDVPADVKVDSLAWSVADDVRDLLEGPGHRWFWRDHSLFLKMEASGEDWHATDVVNLCMDQNDCNPGPRAVGTLPSVQITSPEPGARFDVGSDVVVTANLDDPDSIVSARLYRGLALVAERTSPPWTWTLADVQEGAHVLKLVAEDGSGAGGPGQTYTGTRQFFVGEPVPRIEIVAPAEGTTFLSTEPVTVDFDVWSWSVSAGGDHLKVLANGVEHGDLFSVGPTVLSNLPQGRNEIRVAAVQADGTVRAINDTVTVYVMEDGLLADFEDGVDVRGALTPDGTNVEVTPIRFAWGTSHPVASRADGEDDMNYYDVINNDDGSIGSATYRFTISPARDLTGYTHIRIRVDGLPYELWVDDAGDGMARIGPWGGPTTTLQLEVAPIFLDDVQALELRYDEASAPAGGFARQHLRYIELLAP